MRTSSKIIGLCFLSLIAMPACAEEMGRLFFTPGQRTQLDHGYSREARPENRDSRVLLNGIVQQHGGKRTVWINGVPQQAGQSDERSPDAMPVAIPGQTKSVKVKVGQKLIITPAPPGKE